MPKPQNRPMEEAAALRADTHLHSPSNVDPKGKECYICGAEGFRGLIATCRDCKSIFVHLYCMKKVQLRVPNDWICEDCSEIPKQEKPSAVHTAEQSRRKKGTSGKQTKKQKTCAKDSVHNRTPSVLKPSPDTATKPRHGSGQGDDPYKVNLKGNMNTRDQRLNASENWLGEKWTVDRYLPNHPSSAATWLGCFVTCGLFPSVSPLVTVWGFPPTKVAKKAYKFSKTMPGVLPPFEAIPRSAVCEEMFNGYAPGANDIGLYFFPDDDRSAHYYSCLVSHVEKQDIILKSCINGINLLIFSSSLLDEESKEINDAHYLWGLFVDPMAAFKEPVQTRIPSKTNAEAAFEHGTENGEDTDMVGGGAVRGAGYKVQVTLEKWDGEELLKENGEDTDMVEGGAVEEAGYKAQVNLEKWDGEELLKENGEDTDMVGGGAVEGAGYKVQVKLEKWDGEELPSPPGFPLAVPRVVPSVPPGFDESWRGKF